ncbi:MAG: flagellar biosynthesis anti-sigma factor FlgM [Planctomycetota bacterium]|nr:MAG: flagellar biosynthesis anti-sigma factor FlgM [Planctomycetota bacterium]
MNNIPPINNATHAPSVSATQESKPTSAADRTTLTDRVEISELAQTMNKLGLDINDIRVDKVSAIREAITNDTYVTEDKIEITVNRILEVLKAPSQA